MKKILLNGWLIRVVIVLILFVSGWLFIYFNGEKNFIYGDAKIIKKRNLMNTMVYSLQSRKFSLGQEGEVILNFKDLPSPCLPMSLIVPSPGYNDGRTGYLTCKLRISFETEEGVVFFSNELDLSVLQRIPSNNYCPSSIYIYDYTNKPTPYSKFLVRITILRKSSNPHDKAYLHSSSFDQESLH